MTESQQSPATVSAPQESEGNGNANIQSEVRQESSAVPASSEVPKELEVINKAAKRQYKTLEEAEKGISETYSYVGTLGQRAAIVDKLAERIASENEVSKEDATKYLELLLEQTPVAQPEQSSSRADVPTETKVRVQETLKDYQLQTLSQQVQEEKLLRKFPEAESNMDLIKNIHKATGREFFEIYEKDILPLVEVGKKQAYESQSTKQGASVVTSGATPPPADPYNETFKKFQRGQASVIELLKAKGLRIGPKE
jgi:hypothetical protein